jgi:hypothetical protein
MYPRTCEVFDGDRGRESDDRTESVASAQRSTDYDKVIVIENRVWSRNRCQVFPIVEITAAAGAETTIAAHARGPP